MAGIAAGHSWMPCLQRLGQHGKASLEFEQEVLFYQQFSPVIKYVGDHDCKFSRTEEMVSKDDDFFVSCIHHTNCGDLAPGTLLERPRALHLIDDVFHRNLG